MCAIDNLKVLYANLTGFSFSQNAKICFLYEGNLSKLITFGLPLFPWNHQKTIGFQREYPFYMFCKVLNTSINTAAKHMLNDYWWALKSKGCMVLKGLCLVSSFQSVFSGWFFQRKNNFFHFFEYFLSSVLQILPLPRINVVSFYVLASTLAIQSFCFIGNALSVGYWFILWMEIILRWRLILQNWLSKWNPLRSLFDILDRKWYTCH